MLQWKAFSSKHTCKECHEWVFLLLFFPFYSFVIWAKQFRINHGFNNSPVLRDYTQPKEIVPLRPRNPSHSSHDFNVTSVFAGKASGRQHRHRGASARIQHQIILISGVRSACLGSPNSVRRLWQKRINYAVISCNLQPHQSQIPRWWTLTNSLNLGSLGRCCDSEWEKN